MFALRAISFHLNADEYKLNCYEPVRYQTGSSRKQTSQAMSTPVFSSLSYIQVSCFISLALSTYLNKISHMMKTNRKFFQIKFYHLISKPITGSILKSQWLCCC